ncbi:hypothetical protein HX882_32145 [Pseudomonas gingeri]|uniref:Uncharacterized protein n=1 Tax=Pseudomonas gingeri TaxID=117681 RepID=A0A7Y8C6N3_9PSED|nr:hypothetical protein [Pseudomonas gingeri]NWC00533.1 hypothetical protein [Pseudomonas gingeri]
MGAKLMPELSGIQRSVGTPTADDGLSTRRAYGLLYALLSWMLVGCSIPYQTPKALRQTEHDLKIPQGSVQALNQTNGCYLPYGSDHGGDGQCRVQK